VGGNYESILRNAISRRLWAVRLQSSASDGDTESDEPRNTDTKEG